MVRIALRVLRTAERSGTPRSNETRLALYVLIPYVEEYRLTAYWKVTAQERTPQRSFNLRAQLRLFEAICANRFGSLDIGEGG